MQTLGVGLFLFVRHAGGNGTVYRRNDIKRDGFDVTRFLVESDCHVIVFAERHLAISELTVLSRPYQHITFTGGKECLPFSIRLLIGYGIELGIVIYFELDIGSGSRLAVFIHNGDRCFGRRGIIVDHVDLGVTVGYVHDFFRSVVFAEYFRVHQHTTVSRSVEPPQVKYRFRFTGSEEIPFTVYPSFHPSMVVVGMRPTRRIDLTGRYADRTKGGYGKRRLFATTPVSGLHGCQRRTRPGVRRRIDHFLVAPMVHFQHGVIQGQALHPVFQFFIKDHAALVQILVVDPHGKYEMAEDVFRYAVSPRHFHPCTKRTADIVEIQLPVIIRDISDRHIGIQESKRLFFVGRHLLVKD